MPKSAQRRSHWCQKLAVAVGLPLSMGCTAVAGGGPSSGRAHGTPGPATTVDVTMMPGSPTTPTTGTTGTPLPGTPPGPGVSTAAAFPASPQALRRLTTEQFNNSLRALLGSVNIKPVQADGRANGLAVVGARTVVTSLRGVEQYQEAVDDALDQVFADPTKRSTFVGCEPKTVTSDACTSDFVQRFGRLAFRRALAPDEVSRYVGVAEASAQALTDPYAGPRWSASALLQSLSFLYRPELGVPVNGQVGLFQATDLEVASRLAFFLWGAPPDDALLKAAEAGTLTTVDGVRAEAMRMLASPQSKAAAGGFAADYYDLDRVSTIAKDSALFPNFTPSLASAMEAEVKALFEGAMQDPAASALDLFTTRTRYVNLDLAKLYGLPTDGLSDALVKMDAPANSPRAGLLASGVFLSLYANQVQSSPTTRGKFIREKLLCQTIPPPPVNVDTKLPDAPPGVVLSHREKLLQHATMPACAGCHQLTDPLGFGLENFDAIGAYRTEESGKPVDATGTLDGVAFDGPGGLGQALAANPATTDCLVRALYQYGTGSALSAPADVPLRQLTDKFTAGGHKLMPLALDIVASEGFRFLTSEGAQP